MKEFSKDVLTINVSEETKRISSFITKTILKNMHKRGAVIGLSGGIDSALSAALCVKALGSEKVLGIILPERDSSSISEEYALLLAERLGIQTKKTDITPILERFSVYEKRDRVVGKIFPDFDPSTWLYKIVLPKNSS